MAAVVGVQLYLLLNTVSIEESRWALYYKQIGVDVKVFKKSATEQSLKYHVPPNHQNSNYVYYLKFKFSSKPFT